MIISIKPREDLFKPRTEEDGVSGGVDQQHRAEECVSPDKQWPIHTENDSLSIVGGRWSGLVILAALHAITRYMPNQ